MSEQMEEKKIGMLQKTVTGLLLFIALAAFLAMHVVHAIFFDVLILFLSIVSTYEMVRLLEKVGRPSYRYVALSFPILIFILIIVSQLTAVPAFFVFCITIGIMALSYLFTYLFELLIDKRNMPNDPFKQSTGMTNGQFVLFKTTNTALTFFYPNMLLLFLYFINHLDTFGFIQITNNYGGAHVALFGLLLVFLITVLSDSFAYIFGSLIKGPKLIPKVSKNKTWAGAAFGLLGGIAAALAVYFTFAAIFPGLYDTVHFWQFIVVGLVGSIVSQTGDFFESFLKRRADVKDAGVIFKEHGGMLDRIDSLMFNAPVVFIALLAML